MYSLTLQNSSDTIISSGDRLGQLNFAAPNESDGGASIIVAGGLHVQAEGAFNASSNPTSLVFSTSAADPSGIVPRIKIDQDGNLIPFVDDDNTLGSNSLRFKSAHFSEGIILSDNVPPITTNNLYNTSGTLYFNGSEIGGGGGSYTAGSGLLLVGTEFNVYGGSGHFVNLNVEGPFTATTKSFLINHPSKPGMKLQYGSLEGPENGVYVRGTTHLNLIELPDYWSDLVDPNSVTVTLTSLHQFQPLFVKSKNNREVVVGGVLGEYDYVIWGERKDVAKLKVEWWA
jgi:hypothetical protein